MTRPPAGTHNISVAITLLRDEPSSLNLTFVKRSALFPKGSSRGSVMATLSGSRGTRTHKRLTPPPVFRTGSSSGRMTSVCLQSRIPGVGIEPTPPGSEPGIATNRNCPGVVLFFTHDSGRRIRTSIVGFKDRYPTFRRSPRVSCGSRTHLTSLEGWHLCRSVKDTSFTTSKAEGEGVEPSRHLRTLGRVRGGCHRQLACPSVFPTKAPEQGLEPQSSG